MPSTDGSSIRLTLSRTAWLDVVRGNPLKLAPSATSYPQMSAMADAFKEKYRLYGEKTSPHYSRHYALDAAWLGRIKQTLGSTKQTIHGPPERPSRGWDIIKKFEGFLNNTYPGAAGEERNLAIVKHYKTGADYMGEHNDAKSLRGTPVCSLTIGATRKLILRPAKVRAKGDNKEKRPSFSAKVQHDLEDIVNVWHGEALPPALSASGKAITFSLAHGDVFVMGGSGFQTEFTHELPAEPKVLDGRVGLVIRARRDILAENGETTTSGFRKRANAGGMPNMPAPKTRRR